MKLYIMILILGFIIGFKLAERVYKPMSQSKLVQAVNQAVTSAECTENVYKYTYTPVSYTHLTLPTIYSV